MNRRISFFFLLVLASCTATQPYTVSGSAVTYKLSGGRLGDNLLSYLHALWFAHAHDIPLLYKPFKYSDELQLDDTQYTYNECDLSSFERVVELKPNGSFEINKKIKTLYVIPFFAEKLIAPEFYGKKRPVMAQYPYFPVQWYYTDFVRKMQQLIKPKKSLQQVYPPAGHLSVALHVRRYEFGKQHLHGAAAYDAKQEYVDVNWPFKFLPDEFYISQVKRIAQMFPKRKLYVFIFSDDPKPELLVAKYKKVLNNPNIIFDCRASDNSHTTNVLEDFFSMLNFDCLVHSNSHLSVVASLLGKNKMMISPLHDRWENTMHIVDKVNIVVNEEL